MKAAPQKEATSVQGQVFQGLRKAVPAVQWLLAKATRGSCLLSGQPHTSQGWQGCAMEHQAGQGQHNPNAQGIVFWRHLCPLPPDSSHRDDSSKDKALVLQVGCREITGVREMQDTERGTA